jgi:hypothetical protein
MLKKILWINLIWVVFLAIVLILFFLRDTSPIKEIVSWATYVWVVLAALFAGAVILSRWIIKHAPSHSLKKVKATKGSTDIIPKSENLTDTLTAMHRCLVELQKEKASHTKIGYRQWGKIMPTLADRLGIIELKNWAKFQKDVKRRILRASPTRNFKRRFSFKEFAEYREKVHLAALSVSSEIKKELFQSKKWTLEDAVNVSEWLDGYHWGVKELRDNDPQWDSLFKSISHFSKDEKLSELIQKHVDLSYAYNNICLANGYSRNYPKNSFSSMLHETLVGSPISPEKVELSLNEILNEIEIQLKKSKIHKENSIEKAPKPVPLPLDRSVKTKLSDGRTLTSYPPRIILSSPGSEDKIQRVMFKTEAGGEVHIPTSGSPRVLRFLRPHEVIIREDELPIEVPTGDGRLVVKKFTTTGFIVEEISTYNVQVEVEVYLKR